MKLPNYDLTPLFFRVMEFKTIEGAEKAIEVMHRFEISDRKIIVREETQRDRERMAQMDYDGPSDNTGMRDSIGGGRMSIGGPMMMQQSPMSGGDNITNCSIPGGATSLTPNMLERMGIRGPITDSLYISNVSRFFPLYLHRLASITMEIVFV